jgi:hypothetical protein
MSRWLVFDEPTADAVQTRGGIRPEVSADAVAPARVMELALNSGASLAVVPGEEPGSAVLMRVTRRQSSPKGSAVNPASHMAPAGFLGLSDGIDMDTELERPKKWWQKILD